MAKTKKAVSKKEKITAPKKSKSETRRIEETIKHDDSIKKDSYILTLTLNDGVVMKSIHVSLPDALLNFNKFPQIKTKVILNLKYGNKVLEQPFLPRQIKKAFIDRLYAEILAKRLIILLK